jgi:hypothetical protein
MCVVELNLAAAAAVASLSLSQTFSLWFPFCLHHPHPLDSRGRYLYSPGIAALLSLIAVLFCLCETNRVWSLCEFEV